MTSPAPGSASLSLVTLDRNGWDRPGNPLRRRIPPRHSPGDLETVAHGLFLLLHQSGGAGLAAPQAGLDLRLAVIDTRSEPPLVLLDPVILRRSREHDVAVDACLSLPGWAGQVRRARQAWLAWTDLQGRRHEACFQGYLGRIVQHEVDHLDGTLFTDRLVPGTGLEPADPVALAARAMAVLRDGQPFVPLPDCARPPEAAQP